MDQELGINENPSNTNNNPESKKSSHLVQFIDNKSTKTESEIDLSGIEANEESLKDYTFTKQLLKLDLDKIRELIEILEDYTSSLVEKEDVDLAKTAKQRLILLKKIEKEKMMIEAKIIYSNQIELVEDKMKEELDTYIINSDAEFENIMQRFKEQEMEMRKINKEELEEYKQNFEQTYSQLKPKPSKEYLNWLRIRKCALKQNKFNKAQEANREINRLGNLDNRKFNEDKEKKLNMELKKIKNRQDNEKRVYEMKKNLIITEFNENKQKEINKIKRKYLSKISELKNYQNFEISNFEKITKGVIKPCSRIQNIVSSATGIKEEEEEKNENEENNEENNEEIKEKIKEANEDDADNNNENKNEENVNNDIDTKEEKDEKENDVKDENADKENMEENEEEGEQEVEGDGEEYINKEE
jgi:hypothetical protein